MRKKLSSELRTKIKNTHFFEAVLFTEYSNTWAGSNFITIIYIVFTVIILFTCWLSFNTDTRFMLFGFVELIFAYIISCIANRYMQLKYMNNSIEFILNSDKTYSNWVTVVGIDEKNRIISYMEDNTFGSDNKPYIVDYIATKDDCRRVFKGQRLLILYGCNNKNKLLPLLIEPDYENIICDEMKLDDINITNVKHVPHFNVFNLDITDKRQVIFHSYNNSKVVNNSIYHINTSRNFNMLFVYEWSDTQYKLKYYSDVKINISECTYGDILIKEDRKNRFSRMRFINCKK